MKTHKPKQFRKQHSKQRGDRHQRGYTYRWEQYRKTFLLCNPLCAHCRRVAATEVDHIKAVTGADDPLFWVESNHAGLCKPCHSRKTIRCDGGFGRKRVQ